MKRCSLLTICSILAILAVMGCGSSNQEKENKNSGKLKVVATIGVLADWAGQIGGSQVEVVTLLPGGASPHTFEPTPALAREASEADLIVKIGAGLDGWLDPLLPQDAKVITATEIQGIDLSADMEEHNEDSDDSHHHHSGTNPHVWLDPIYARLVCAEIGEALVELDPEGASEYEANLNRYQAQLDSLDELIEETVADFTSREYVAFHPAWMYFSLRYGLKRVAVVEQVAGQEPSPRKLDSIIEEIRRQGARVIFAEPQLSPKAARVIADEAEIEILILDPLGQPGESYIQMMRHNLETLAGALGD